MLQRVTNRSRIRFDHIEYAFEPFTTVVDVILRRFVPLDAERSGGLPHESDGQST
jgi:hypothetical protein